MAPRPSRRSMAASRFMQADIADNTRRAYLADLHHYTDCGCSIPTTVNELLWYLDERAGLDAVSTLKRRVMAIRYAHVIQGLASPTDDPTVKLVLRNFKRRYGSAQRQAKPLLRRELRKIIRSMNKTAKDLRDKALLLVGFAGAFRRSELIGLNIEDLERVEQGYLIKLRRSKTDQEQIGRIIAIPKIRNSLCPVTAIDRWLQAATIDKGPIFQRLARNGKPNGVRLCAAYVSSVLKSRLRAAGIKADDYSAHSLRAGLVTEAAKAGVPAWKIQQTTGHKTESMLARYIRDADLWTGNAAHAAM